MIWRLTTGAPVFSLTPALNHSTSTEPLESSPRALLSNLTVSPSIKQCHEVTNQKLDCSY